MPFKKALLFAIPLLFAMGLALTAVVPSWRERIQNHFSKVGRDILATAEGDVLNDGSLAKVIKYHSKDGVYVEILKVGADHREIQVDRILLPDKHDGLFNYQGHVTRLAIADIDNDGKLELLAPTFDNQLVPHLNVFRYNPAIGRFEPYTPEATGEPGK